MLAALCRQPLDAASSDVQDVKLLSSEVKSGEEVKGKIHQGRHDANRFFFVETTGADLGAGACDGALGLDFEGDLGRVIHFT